MKKLLFTLVLLLTPFIVKADYGVSNYYIDATVKNNGDLLVKELFVLEGEYNGFEKINDYREYNAKKFDGTANSFLGSNIYDSSGIELIEIKAIKIHSDINKNYLQKDGDVFTKKSYCQNGDYGCYQVTTSSTSASYKIFNPSSKGKKGFYIEYIIKDLAINHSDISEFGWNIFSTSYRESIKNLLITIHIPTNKDTLKVWAHGPLYGESTIIDKNTVELSIKNVNAYTAIDTRVVFDKDAVNSKKKTNVEALDKIIELETRLADAANAKRKIAYQKLIEYAEYKVFLAEDELSYENYNNANIAVLDLKKEDQTKFLERLIIVNDRLQRARIIGYIALSIWIIGLIILVIYVYGRYDKEHDPVFKGKYYRDFPNTYGPEIVKYLFSATVNGDSLSASILNLIEKKVIKYQSINESEIKFSYDPKVLNDKLIQLSPSEKYLLEWLFDSIGDNNEVLLSEIQEKAKLNYNNFLTSYNKWKSLVILEAKSYNFYEKGGKKGLWLLYCIIGAGLTLVFDGFHKSMTWLIIMLIIEFIGFCYFICVAKKTVKGNEDYVKWKGLKNFLKDFGNFPDRELPQIELWGKYLVYSVVFQINEKLSEVMKIKVNEIYNETETNINVGDLYLLTHISSTISLSLPSAIASANSARSDAMSSSSSGSGFGGGFSSGGGGFSGGGGGGRF